MKLLRLSRRWTLIITFIWSWGIWVSWSDEKFREQPVETILAGFVFALILTFVNSIIIARGHFLITRHQNELPIVERLTDLNYVMTRDNDGKKYFRKVNSLLPINKVKLVIKEHYLELHAPEKLLDKFIDFVH